ncbi:MAG: lipocalin [Gammaproteobacteria bacterium]|nr:lipocalin [Gammaproteobacteria bacterium]MAY03042.1 lipocalin [Gammaproteobacteria bacterium]|tara:strand:+ start:2194 stop:2733 length:540 start_codon:yes stop_codon:yes gene_type:complete
MTKKIVYKITSLVACFFLNACTGIPEGIKPVENFDLDSYLGTWYEIARLDNRFEEGMSQVTANYSMNPDGSVQVVNRGYLDESQSWDEVTGKAVFVNNTDTGHLKVSFFGPFYASYVVFQLSDDYSYSYVTGNNRSYLWFLSRSPVVDESSKMSFIAQARELGFAYQDILWVDQEMNIE